MYCSIPEGDTNEEAEAGTSRTAELMSHSADEETEGSEDEGSDFEDLTKEAEEAAEESLNNEADQDQAEVEKE